MREPLADKRPPAIGGVTHLLWKSQFRFLKRHRPQTLLAILGIALGITVVTAVDLTNTSAYRSFELSYQRVMGSATHQVVGGSQGLDEQLYQRLRIELLPYYAQLQAAPVIQTHVHLAGRPHHILQLLAIDPIAEAPFRRFLNPGLTEATEQSPKQLPEQGASGQNLSVRFMLQAGSALLSSITARQLDIKPGDNLRVADNGRILEVTIIGLIGDDHTPQFNNLLLMDIGHAQQLLQRPGKLDRIDLKIPRSQLTEIRQRLASLLPVYAQLETTAAGERQTASLLESFQLNLQALGLLTLLVGIFLINNTMNSFVLQRQLLFARLRALGVERRQLATGILAESLLLGSLGILMGLPLGIGLSQVLLELNTQTINDHYYIVSINHLFLSPVVFIKACTLGLVVTLAAAALPAYRAARQSPSQQLQRMSQEQPLLSPRAKTAAITLLFIATLALALIKSSGLPGGFIAIFCLQVAASLLAPSLLKALARWLSQLLPAATHIAVKMAVRDTGRNLSRTGVAAVALLIAVASVNGIGIMIESFRGTLSQWLQTRVNADAYVRPLKTSAIHQRQFLPESVIQRLRQNPQISATSLYVDFPTTLYIDTHTPTRVELVGAELPPGARRGYRFLHQWDRNPEAIWRAFDRGGILVGEPLANRLSLSVNDQIQLATDRGIKSFKIAGIYYDYGSVQGRVLVNRKQLLRYWDRTGVETLGLYFDPDTAPARRRDLLDRLQQQEAAVPLVLRHSAQVLSQGLAVFDRTFRITQALRLLVLAVALIGIVSALSSLQLERRQELKHLRALGFTRAQRLSLQLFQAALLGVFIGLLAIPLGQGLAWMLVKVINLRAFGWTMVLQPQWDLCLQNLALTLTAAVVAALLAQSPPLARFNTRHAMPLGGQE